MNIAVITQKLSPDDYVFGFFYGHIVDLARVCETVHVVCLECADFKGKALPPNVHVHSLGKNEGAGRVAYLFRFLRFIFSRGGEYDTVLVHMEPLYVLLGGLWWRLTGKRVVLWYNHVYVDFKLRVARYFVHEIIGVSKGGVPVRHKNIRLISHTEDLTSLLTGR
jgi:hypothetical protein